MRFFILFFSLSCIISCGQQESIQKIAEEKRLSKQTYSIKLNLDTIMAKDPLEGTFVSKIPIIGATTRVFADLYTQIKNNEVSGSEQIILPESLDLDQAIIKFVNIKKISLKRNN